MRRLTFAASLLLLIVFFVNVNLTHAAGKIVVVNDDWVLSNAGFTSPNDPGKFATNVAAWFTGSQSGKFHAYSDHFGLTGSSLAAAMTNAGHTWTTGTTGFSFDLATLKQFNGIFLLEAPADNNVLIDYVESGGNVYLAYSGDASHLDEQYNTFVNHFGLGLGTINNGIVGNVAINSSHPIFSGVDSLYNVNGSDIVDNAPLDSRQTVLVMQNGHGLFAVYEAGANFTQADLTGTWYYEGFGNCSWGGNLRWVWGIITVDATGTVTGGTIVDSLGLSDTLASGSLKINSAGQVTGTLIQTNGTIQDLPHGQLNARKTFLTVVNSVEEYETNYRGILMANKGGGVFTQTDLAGNWRFENFGVSPANYASKWGWGTMTINASGNVTSGTVEYSTGESFTLTGGSFTINSAGQITGSLVQSDGVTLTLPHGKMDEGKTILNMVNSADNPTPIYRGIFSATKDGGDFTQADLSGIWHINTIAAFQNNMQWKSGTLMVDANGTVTGGTLFDDFGIFSTITGGTLTIDSSGQVSGSVVMPNGMALDLPHGTLDIGKTALVMDRTDSFDSYQLSKGLLVATKSVNQGITFNGTVENFPPNPIAGARLEMVENPSLWTYTDANGLFSLSGLPSGTNFTVKVSKDGFLPDYTPYINTTTDITLPSSINLFTPNQASTWGPPSKGFIGAKIMDLNNPGNFLNCAVMTATSTNHPETPYSVTYFDGANFGGSCTYSNGIAIVMNVDEGDTVTVQITSHESPFASVFPIHANAEGGTILYGKAITPRSGNISVSPSPKNFGGIMVGGSSDTQISAITNNGPGDLTLLSAYWIGDNTDFNPTLSISNPCASWPGILNSGESCNVAATFTPKSVGTQKATFVINSSANNTPVFNHPLSGTGVTPFSLTLNIAGGGTVNNYSTSLIGPSFTPCSQSSCTYRYGAGSEFILGATPSEYFSGWTGICTNNSGNCQFTLTENTTVTANFQNMPLVKVLPSHPNTVYQTLQGAYNEATNSDQLKARNIVFSDTSLTLDHNINISLKGGLESDFYTVSGLSYLQGILTIGTGSLTVENLCIK